MIVQDKARPSAESFSLDRAKEMTKPVLTLQSERRIAAPTRASVLVFEDPSSQALLEHIRLIAPSGANALIVGETGTGKEIIARHIHELSARSQGPFVALNCGAFSEQLVESELFGHERGAFTGAVSSKPGWFEVAHGGTLFLDEIGDLPLTLQVKLLRVLQEPQVVRVGSRKPIDIDVRMVAATNVNLENQVNSGRFREDLYYRLNVAHLHLAPLRERPRDIPVLVEHFLRIYSERLGLRNIRVSPEAMETLIRGHSWPGNIRELENVIHRAILIRRDNIIRPEDLNLSSLRSRVNALSPSRTQPSDPAEALKNALVNFFKRGGGALDETIEAYVIRTAYEFCHRNQLETARLLGISRNIVRARLLRCGELTGKPRARDQPPEAEAPLAHAPVAREHD
jgi:sigma-54 dependent transcriptional regulator